MKPHSFTLVALSAFSLLANAGAVHIDVSHNGDVAVDVNTEQKTATLPKFGEASKPVYPPGEEVHALGEYEVDLKYEIHEGFPSESDKSIRFDNIPYAEPPTGDLRWRKPVPPQTRRKDVNNGSISNICPQFQAGWVFKAGEFLVNFSNLSLLRPEWEDPIPPWKYYPMQPQPAGVNEDCLTLDVVVPKTVWDDRNETKAAVLVWIYGGGFIFGNKNQHGSPEGLFDAAAVDGGQNFIYVAMNYRLGAFGWLGGPKFQEQGGIPNVGLHDQKAALEWVQEYITQFGGDPDRVTVMGQSAGAASIMHHITASGGRSDRPPINQAILQSPGFFPQPNSTQDDETYQQFLNLTGAEDLDDLRNKCADALMIVNNEMTYYSLYGYFKFGPTVDGDGGYVPDLPGKLLENNEFHRGFPLLLGYTKRDGLLFTPPWIRSNEQLREHVRQLFPKVTDDVLHEIDTRYPIDADIAKSKVLQVSDFLDDIAIQCNVQYLTESALNSGPSTDCPIYRYVFNALPALHGYDLSYAYYPEPQFPPLPVNERLAKFLQSTVVNFVRYTNPNQADPSVLWEEYNTATRTVMNFGSPSQTILPPNYVYSSGDDVLDADKCNYWQLAPYYSPDDDDDDDDDEEEKAQLIEQSNVYKEYL